MRLYLILLLFIGWHHIPFLQVKHVQVKRPVSTSHGEGTDIPGNQSTREHHRQISPDAGMTPFEFGSHLESLPCLFIRTCHILLPQTSSSGKTRKDFHPSQHPEVCHEIATADTIVLGTPIVCMNLAMDLLSNWQWLSPTRRISLGVREWHWPLLNASH